MIVYTVAIYEKALCNYMLLIRTGWPKHALYKRSKYDNMSLRPALQQIVISTRSYAST